MSSGLNRVRIGEGIHLNTIRDEKFKHNRLSVNFILPLERENASDNAVVPFVLRKGYRECPDFTSLNARLAELYGAVLDGDVTKYGAYQVLELSIRGLDDRFALEKEEITAACADLLASVALDPKLDGEGLLDARDVALERQYVVDSIDAEINEKRAYAVSRCIQIMCSDEPVAVRRYGERATAQAITPQSATAAYHRMVEQATVEIMFVGSGSNDSAVKVFTERFRNVARNPIPCPPVLLRGTAGQVREEVEQMGLSQSKLVMGLRTGTAKDVREVTARRVFAALFGGTPFSKLFLNVREKLSLCYYCAARYDVSTGLLLVDSGVEAKNKQLAQEEILRQLKAIQDGGLDQEELRNTKLLMKNSVTANNDSLSGLEGWYMSQIMRGMNATPEEDVALIETITREEVVAAAKAVTLDTVYFLKGNEEGEGA